MKSCEWLGTCGFLEKYRDSNEFACEGFIRKYCKGPKMNQCKRKQFFETYGQPPLDDMLPNGALMKEI